MRFDLLLLTGVQCWILSLLLLLSRPACPAQPAMIEIRGSPTLHLVRVVYTEPWYTNTSRPASVLCRCGLGCRGWSLTNI
ncbi:hypothetical protein M430DRAFT_160685 [Amorphotheca resinae ATCC 22711]|uniref:Post-SET domain-containing protein n=1 Tax=Amorphotheca resinae ATCC 22711 TaxID=857342 RepID=A0A2T3BEU2_AMORE|nr:hypothetical protein M430DRAFT_160685 [Amorphotheca resinae ATCC 22711]PSS27926.1 hypothetical protein M430DRAFT_160685 [Amorphotheca resinae ATCC 22711]